MPYRILNVWTLIFGVLGLCLLAWLLMRNRSIDRAARTGPLWKRRSLAAAMLLLSAMGLATTTNTACIPTFTCYEPVPGAYMDRKDFRSELEQLERRLPLLEKYVGQGVIDRQVVGTVLDTAEWDYQLLKTGFAKEKLSPAEYQRAEELCEKAKPIFQAIRAKLGLEPDESYRMHQWRRQQASQPTAVPIKDAK